MQIRWTISISCKAYPRSNSGDATTCCPFTKGHDGSQLRICRIPRTGISEPDSANFFNVSSISSSAKSARATIARITVSLAVLRTQSTSPSTFLGRHSTKTAARIFFPVSRISSSKILSCEAKNQIWLAYRNSVSGVKLSRTAKDFSIMTRCGVIDIPDMKMRFDEFVDCRHDVVRL